MQELLEILSNVLFSILNSRTTEFERLSLVHYLSFILEFQQVLKVNLHSLHVHPHKLGRHLAKGWKSSSKSEDTFRPKIMFTSKTPSCSSGRKMNWTFFSWFGGRSPMLWDGKAIWFKRCANYRGEWFEYLPRARPSLGAWWQHISPQLYFSLCGP